jgi:hypothetical protein
MEISQGNSLCDYLKQKMPSFFFSFTELENRRAKLVLPGGVGTSGRGERWGKVWDGDYGASTVYTCMKMEK